MTRRMQNGKTVDDFRIGKKIARIGERFAQTFYNVLSAKRAKLLR